MSNDTTQHTPADVRERVTGAWATVEAAALAQANLLDSNFVGQRAQAAEIRNAVAHVAALLRTPRGEEEDTIPVSALRSEIALLRKHRLLPYLAWARLCALAGGEPVGEDSPAARRSDAQGEDRWEDLVFGPITEAYNEAHAAHRSEGGGA